MRLWFYSSLVSCCIIQRLVVLYRQLISSFQLFCLKGMVEKCNLSGPGWAKVMIAKSLGIFTREVVQEKSRCQAVESYWLLTLERHLQ